jgi:hypothetical protein
VSGTGREPREEAAAERIDKEAEQHQLEAAGWERIERQGKIVWRNPNSGFLYPQGAAISLVRERASLEDIPSEPEGEA